MEYERKCLICGEDFIANRKTGKYCSSACLYEANRRKAKKAGKYKTRCVVCGVEFEGQRENCKYCDKEYCQFMKYSQPHYRPCQVEEYTDTTLLIVIEWEGRGYTYKEIAELMNRDLHGLEKFIRCSIANGRYDKVKNSMIRHAELMRMYGKLRTGKNNLILRDNRRKLARLRGVIR